MKKKLLYLTPIVLLAAAAFVNARGAGGGRETATPAVAPPAAPLDVIAAPGRVEPASEEIQIASQVAGRLESIPVHEADHIRRGQVLAILSNADYRARLSEAEAQLRLQEAELRRTVNGAREQQRREARNQAQETESVVASAGVERDRARTLFQESLTSRQALQQAEREYDVARARHDAARERLDLIEAAAREEDRSKAEAEVELARARVEEAKALLDKTIIRSPIDGVVLRKHRREGESIMDLTQVQPIVTVGDLSSVRVRAEVDETEIAAVRVGQRAWVTASAYGERKFLGHVVRVAASLGKKNVRTDDPTERNDTRILEVLLEFDGKESLPTGLRVDAFIETGKRLEP